MLTGEVGTHSSEPTGSCEEDDIILSCRLHLADKDWSQQPLVLATSADFAKLPEPYPTRVNPRLQLSDKQRKEFEKTAWKITQSPWQMHLGSAYLLKLCQDNVDNHSDDWHLPCMDWMLTGTRQDLDLKEEPTQLDEKTFQWNHMAAATVSVTRPSKRLKVKQPELHRRDCHPFSGAPNSEFGRHGAPSRTAPGPEAAASSGTPAAAATPKATAAKARGRPRKRPAAAEAHSAANKQEGEGDGNATPDLPSPPPSENDSVVPSLPSPPPSQPSPPPSPPQPEAGDAGPEQLRRPASRAKAKPLSESQGFSESQGQGESWGQGESRPTPSRPKSKGQGRAAIWKASNARRGVTRVFPVPPFQGWVCILPQESWIGSKLWPDCLGARNWMKIIQRVVNLQEASGSRSVNCL